jgi:hypothetical protein
MSIVTIDDVTVLLREFGPIDVQPNLTVSDMALIAGALRFVMEHPSVLESEVVLTRVRDIIDKIRFAVNGVDESLDVLFQNAIKFEED